MELTKTGRFFLFAIPITLVGGYLIYRRIQGSKTYSEALVPTSIPKIPVTTGSSTTPSADVTQTQTGSSTDTGGGDYQPMCLDLLIETDMANVYADSTDADNILAQNSECGYRKYVVNTLTSDLNVRKSPSLTAEIADSLPKGQILIARASTTKGWMQKLEDAEYLGGFVSADFIKAI